MSARNSIAAGMNQSGIARAREFSAEMFSTCVFIALACCQRRMGSFSNARSTTSSRRTSRMTLREGGESDLSGSSPVSIW